MLERFILIVTALLVPATTNAASLYDIADKAPQQMSPFLWGIVLIVIIGGVGLIGYCIFYWLDDAKMCKMIKKAMYMGAGGVVLSMGLLFIGNIVVLIKRFVDLVLG